MPPDLPLQYYCAVQVVFAVLLLQLVKLEVPTATLGNVLPSSNTNVPLLKLKVVLPLEPSALRISEKSALNELGSGAHISVWPSKSIDVQL